MKLKFSSPETIEFKDNLEYFNEIVKLIPSFLHTVPMSSPSCKFDNSSIEASTQGIEVEGSLTDRDFISKLAEVLRKEIVQDLNKIINKDGLHCIFGYSIHLHSLGTPKYGMNWIRCSKFYNR